MKRTILYALIVMLSLQCKNSSKQDFTIESSCFPYVITGKNGAYLSWTTMMENGEDCLMIGHYNGDVVTQETTVACGTDWFVNWADTPELAFFKSGKYITHWLEKTSPDTYDYNVTVAIGDLGAAKPDTIFTLHNDGVPAEHGFVSYTPIDDKIMAVWLDGRNTKSLEVSGAMSLRSCLINDEGQISERTEVDDRVCDCCQTDLTLHYGMPYLVYRGRDGEEIRGNIMRWYEEGAWSEPYIMDTSPWKIAGCPVNGPSISSFGGQVYTTWFTQANGYPEVNVSRWNEEEKAFSDSQPVSDSLSIGRMDMLAFHNHLYVSYISTEENQASVMLNEYDLNFTLLRKILVCPIDPSRGSGCPKILMADDNLSTVFTENGEYEPEIRFQKINL